MINLKLNINNKFKEVLPLTLFIFTFIYTFFSSYLVADLLPEPHQHSPQISLADLEVSENTLPLTFSFGSRGAQFTIEEKTRNNKKILVALLQGENSNILKEYRISSWKVRANHMTLKLKGSGTVKADLLTGKLTESKKTRSSMSQTDYQLSGEQLLATVSRVYRLIKNNKGGIVKQRIQREVFFSGSSVLRIFGGDGSLLTLSSRQGTSPSLLKIKKAGSKSAETSILTEVEIIRNPSTNRVLKISGKTQDNRLLSVEPSLKRGFRVSSKPLDPPSPPVAEAALFEGSEDSGITGKVQAESEEGLELVYQVLEGPSHGTLELNRDGTFNYTPNTDFNGEDFFTYKANDGTKDSNIAQVTLQIVNVNDAPVFDNPNLETFEFEHGVTEVLNLVAGDVDADALSFEIIEGAASFATLVDHGNGTASLEIFHEEVEDQEEIEYEMTIRVRDSHGIYSDKRLKLICMCTEHEHEPGDGDYDVNDDGVIDRVIATHHDTIPTFGADNPDILIEQDTNWSEIASTLTGNEVIVVGKYATLTIDTDIYKSFKTLAVMGKVEFRSDVNTKLVVTNFLVLEGAELTIGTEDNPIASNVSAEIIIRGTPLDTGTLENPGTDPKQYGNGLIVWGKVTMHGRVAEQTFTQFAQEPRAGDTELVLNSVPSGWKVGDVLVIPDSEQIPFTEIRFKVPSKTEEVMIIGISGNRIQLSQALNFDHLAIRDSQGEIFIMPHLAKLTSNVTIRSESPSGVRSHTMYLHRAEVDIRYVHFKDLGRTTVNPLDSITMDAEGNVTHIGTNQIGRYSLHLHHLWGPRGGTESGYQYRLEGNIIDGGPKWGMTIHDSHYGLISKNVVYDVDGSGIVTEEGNETGNLFENNIVLGGMGKQRFVEDPNNANRGGIRKRGADNASDHSGFWFRGPNNIVRNNIAVNMNFAGFNYNGYYAGSFVTPNFPGADMHDPTQVTQWNARTNGPNSRAQAIPLMESSGNQVYASSIGLWATWFRGSNGGVVEYEGESVFKDFKMAHITRAGVLAYHNSRMTFDGFTLINDPEVSKRNGGGSNGSRINHGIFFDSPWYENGLMKVTNFHIEGFNIGIEIPANMEDETVDENAMWVQNGFLKNYINIKIPGPNTQLRGDPTSDITAYIDNVRFESSIPMPGIRLLPSAPLDIWMSFWRSKNMKPTQKLSVLVTNFDQIEGQDFQVYFKEQAPDVIVPQSNNPLMGAPEPGLTNQQSFAKYGIALGGFVAPCTNEVRGIEGFVCAN